MAFQSKNESSSRLTLGSSRRRSSKQDTAGGAVSTFSVWDGSHYVEGIHEQLVGKRVRKAWLKMKVVTNGR